MPDSLTSTMPVLTRCALLIFVCTLMLAQVGFARAGDAGASPVGTWMTQDGDANVKIGDCGGKLCGTIVWLKQPLDGHGQPKLDNENPDRALRSRPLVGLPLLTNFARSKDPNVWRDGLIYDPEDGRTYRCTLTVVGDKTLRVHGYIGISLLGRSQNWTRIDGVTAPPAAK
jgi:uncharacterized protein (DUF2147 family)